MGGRATEIIIVLSAIIAVLGAILWYIWPSWSRDGARGSPDSEETDE